MCLGALVHLFAGFMLLPVVLHSSWESVSPTGHLVFFTGTWLAIGWCLFDMADASFRCFGREYMPTGLSGIECPCPRSFWAVLCLLNYPFYFALVLPMNAMLADVTQYHELICAHLLGTGAALLLRQAALVMSALGRSKRQLVRTTLSAYAVIIIICRGALYFPLIVDCAGYLREVDPSGSVLLTAPSITMGIINIVLILEAVRTAAWCTPSDAQLPATAPLSGARPLRAADGDGPDSAVDDGAEDEDVASARPQKSSRSSKSKRSKGQRGSKSSRARSRDASRERSVEWDEEEDFGVADKGSRYLSDEDMPPTRTSSNGNGHGTSARESGNAHKPPEQESERARLRRELEAARRRNEAREAAAGGVPAGVAAAQAAAVVPPLEAPVDHSVIFATGKMPRRCSHYAMLGLSRSATTTEIKKAFLQLSMRWHPDKNPSDSSKAEIVFMGIKDAYDCLSDPTRKRRYDKTGVG